MKKTKKSSESSGLTHNSQLIAHDFLLEIGCEEIPADYLAATLDWNWPDSPGLASIAGKLLIENQVIFRRLQSYATCRRLVLRIIGVEPIVKETVMGPPVSVGLDSQGRPTEAAKGFARKQGVGVSALTRSRTPGGERLIAERKISVEERLVQIIPVILQKLYFPKTMRWNELNFRFVRPIRWAIALYGSKPLRLSLAGIKSGTATYGSRRYGDKPVPVRGVASYFTSLSRLKVHLEQGRPFEGPEDDSLKPIPFEKKKRQAVLGKLKEAAQRLRGRLADEATEEFNWLLDTVTFLSEDPVVEVGTFEKRYLELPSEVLATSMAKYLKLFSVYSADGKKLFPQFLAVLEGSPKNPQEVLKNIEDILQARFSDARFFLKEDTRSPLEAKIPQLATLVFHEKLGAVADRIPRLTRLMEELADQLGSNGSMKEKIRRVAQLSKADLVTQMVREFPSLQGIVGRYYALEDGEPKEVAEALAEQYHPRTTGDPVPRTLLGALASLADRIDALVGFFGVGLKPTGSLDPYALRRQALGLIRILIQPPKGITSQQLSIDRLISVGIESWKETFRLPPDLLKEQVFSFLKERFEWIAVSKHRIDRELVLAVLAAPSADLSSAWDRLSILSAMWRGSEKPDLIRAGKVMERTSRIVQSSKEADKVGKPDPSKWKLPEEENLWKTWEVVEATTGGWIEKRQYDRAAAEYGKLYPQLHQFFEKVFVMDEDPEVRRNRLAMMKDIYFLFANSVGDLSKLPLPAEI